MLRQLKIKNGFSSDDTTICHLISGHQSLCLLKMLASSAGAAQLGGTSVTDTGSENYIKCTCCIHGEFVDLSYWECINGATIRGVGSMKFLLQIVLTMMLK